jgi:hypothetical protein
MAEIHEHFKKRLGDFPAMLLPDIRPHVAPLRHLVIGDGHNEADAVVLLGPVVFARLIDEVFALAEADDALGSLHDVALVGLLGEDVVLEVVGHEFLPLGLDDWAVDPAGEEVSDRL